MKSSKGPAPGKGQGGVSANGGNAPAPAKQAQKVKAIGGDQGTNSSEAKKLFQDGKKYFQGKGSVTQNLDIAYNYFDNAITKDPNLGIAYNYRARVNQCRGEFARAIPDFTMAIQLDSANQGSDPKIIGDHWNFAGQCYFELGQYEEALRHYESAIKKDNANGLYYFNRAHVKSKLDKLDECIADYTMALEKLSDTNIQYQALFNKGVCLRRMGRLDESIDDLKKAVGLKNDKSAAHNNLGLSYFEKEEYDEALSEFTKAIALEQHPFHYNNRGLAYYHIGQNDLANKDFDEAIKKQSDDPLVYFNRGNVFLNQGDYDKAHADFDTAISKDPKNSKIWHAKGLAYEARAMKDPKHIDQNLQKMAVDMFKQSISISENFTGSRFHLGLLYHRINRFDKALQCLSSVLMKMPKDKSVYIARGLVYQDMGNHQFAINDFNAAISIEPTYAEAFYRRGISQLKSRRYMEAIEDFKQSYELDTKPEKNPGVYDGQGCCYHALRDYDKALTFFNTAIDKNQQNTQFLMNRAQCYYDLKMYTESIRDLTQALQINETDPQILYRLGLAYYAFEKYKKCIKTLKAAISSEPFHSYEADIFYHIGLAYCNQEKFEKAIFPFSECIKRNPSDIRYIHERAKAFQMIEDHTNAVEDFSVVIKKNPKNAHAYFRRAFSNKALKKYAEAADDFERAKELDPLNPKLVVNYKKLKGITCIVLCKPGEEKEFK